MSFRFSIAVCLLSCLAAAAQGADKVPASLNFEMKSLTGKPVKLSQYQGKVVLLVNVASACGATPQYEQLQSLHKKYAGEGLAVVGVPANEFGAQEPGSDAEIATFCKSNYGVEFDMLSKVVVKGDGICPLYAYITKESKFPGPIGWNFEKFLIGRNGEVVARFKTGVSPDAPEVIAAIEKELAKK
ncbi:MAG: glutathione peroxidase [Planctomycetia bacterium]|nr:glutathione peroxidase [Planctomycetia bacterium]